MEEKGLMYSREIIVESLEGTLDRVNAGACAYDSPGDEIYWNGYRDAIKGLLVNFGVTRSESEDRELASRIKSHSKRKGRSSGWKASIFVGVAAIAVGAILRTMGLSNDSSVVAAFVTYWGALQFWR